MTKMKIGSHFTLDGERWEVISPSAVYTLAINSAGKRRRFPANQLEEKLQLKFVNSNPRRRPVKSNQALGVAGLVDRCIVKCGVSREHIERLARGTGLPIRTVAKELLDQQRGG